MTQYLNLSRLGKLRKLRQLAVVALSHYDLDEPILTYHAFETNLLYRVTASSGERFMLRLATPGWRSLTDLRSEAMWLEALARDTPIPLPVVVRTRSGEHVVPTSHPEIPDPWNASLMRWISGRDLGHYLTPQNCTKMGELFAVLHEHGASWKPPAGFSTRRFEHWLSRGEENRVTGNGHMSGARIDKASRGVLERMDRHVEAAYAAVDRADLRVIHCDLWHDNIKLHHGTLCPLDFEDTVWGFRSHDIAMAMLDLFEDTDEERYPRLLAAFRRGYESLLSWPDEPIEPFQIGRLLWKINWVAHNEPEWLGHMVQRHIPVFAHYEERGTVTLPPA
jgi:Ser/Thr protein kinase RdoA (MazF antagonist)